MSYLISYGAHGDRIPERVSEDDLYIWCRDLASDIVRESEQHILDGGHEDDSPENEDEIFNQVEGTADAIEARILNAVPIDYTGTASVAIDFWFLKEAGTTFTLRIPLTVTIVDAFAFECAGQAFVHGERRST